MTRYCQWLQQGSYGANVDRELIAALWPAPASQGCAVTVSSGMVLSVAPGQVAVPTQNSTGSTLCTSTAPETVTLPAAPASGTNRIDLVICQPRGNDLDGGSNNDFIFTSIQGAAVASPTVPATPAGAVALAQIYVGGGVASIVATNITDIRPFGLNPHGAARLPDPVAAGATLTSWTDADGEVWVAKGNVNAGAWRKARDVLNARIYRAAAFTMPTGSGTAIPFDTAARDSYGMFAAGSYAIQAPVAGHYRVSAQIGAVATATGQVVNAFLRGGSAGTTRLTQHTAHAATAGGVYGLAGDTVQAASGDLFTLEAYSATGGLTAAVGPILAYLTVDYVGTG